MTLTFDLDIQTHPSEEPNTSSLWIWRKSVQRFPRYFHHHHHHNRFTALFRLPPGWAGARRELLDFMVQGKINRGRHTDHLAGRHSIQTNQCLPPPSPHFLQAGCPSCRPTNSVKALKTISQDISYTKSHRQRQKTGNSPIGDCLSCTWILQAAYGVLMRRIVF